MDYSLIFTEINSDIKGWNVGTRIDSYIADFILLYNTGSYIYTKKQMHTKISQLKDRKVTSGTFNQMVKNLQSLSLIESKGNKYILVKFDYDNILLPDVIDYLSNLIKNHEVNLDAGHDLKLWYSFSLLVALENNLIDHPYIETIKGVKGNLKSSFYNLYYKEEKANSILYNFYSKDNLDKILLLLSYKIENATMINYLSKIKDGFPLVDNIDGDSNRDQEKQAEFRRGLIDEAEEKGIKGCWLCGKQTIDLLEAAHIIPHGISDFNISNGLLLCKNHHSQYDAGYISFHANGEVSYHKKYVNNLDVLDANEDSLHPHILTADRKKYISNKGLNG